MKKITEIKYVKLHSELLNIFYTHDIIIIYYTSELLKAKIILIQITTNTNVVHSFENFLYTVHNFAITQRITVLYRY